MDRFVSPSTSHVTMMEMVPVSVFSKATFSYGTRFRVRRPSSFKLRSPRPSPLVTSTMLTVLRSSTLSSSRLLTKSPSTPLTSNFSSNFGLTVRLCTCDFHVFWFLTLIATYGLLSPSKSRPLRFLASLSNTVSVPDCLSRASGSMADAPPAAGLGDAMAGAAAGGAGAAAFGDVGTVCARYMDVFCAAGCRSAPAAAAGRDSACRSDATAARRDTSSAFFRSEASLARCAAAEAPAATAPAADAAPALSESDHEVPPLPPPR
mmetsp:Transcript_4710/g.15419  ORF Transcript_4710/g.15419 Transcript_4710/m.15419 type:complete len:263 (-) Transcript_4710:6277-7065(-)